MVDMTNSSQRSWTGEDFEKVRDEIIKTFYEYTDNKTGKKPVLFALKRENARVIGLHGDRIGDVIFALSPEFGEQHGPLSSYSQIWHWILTRALHYEGMRGQKKLPYETDDVAG